MYKHWQKLFLEMLYEDNLNKVLSMALATAPTVGKITVLTKLCICAIWWFSHAEKIPKEHCNKNVYKHLVNLE